jgi:hypothetical protein
MLKVYGFALVMVMVVGTVAIICAVCSNWRDRLIEHRRIERYWRLYHHIGKSEDVID